MTDERGDRPPAVDPAASVESLRHLAAKVLEDARRRAARGSRGEIAWFESDAEGEGAFRWWCAVLDWDVVKTRERMREAVRRSRAKREALIEGRFDDLPLLSRGRTGWMKRGEG